MIDYKELLAKYMAHVGAIEGVYFLYNDWSRAFFITPAEWEELKEVSKLADKIGLK